MKYYVGIDGGGTKTKLLLADENLRVIAEHTGSIAAGRNAAGGVFKMGERITTPLNKTLAEHNMKFVQPLYDPAIGSLILAKKNDNV